VTWLQQQIGHFTSSRFNARQDSRFEGTFTAIKERDARLSLEFEKARHKAKEIADETDCVDLLNTKEFAMPWRPTETGALG
jgi:hypothetical protein